MKKNAGRVDHPGQSRPLLGHEGSLDGAAPLRALFKALFKKISRRLDQINLRAASKAMAVSSASSFCQAHFVR